MTRLTDEQLASIEVESSSGCGDYGDNPDLRALVAEVREHRARLARPQPKGRIATKDIESIERTTYADRDELLSMARELLTRRAGDLTPDEIKYLARYLRDGGHLAEARLAFEKILRAHGSTP